MQPLQSASKSRERRCVEEVMAAVPPVLWFMRRHMRSNRGNLSIPQFRALARTRREPSVSISAISEHLGTSLSTTSRVVSGLVQRKLLMRDVSPTDRRQVGLTITEKGRSILEAARGVTRRQLKSVFRSVAPEDQDVLIHAMQILRDIFGQVNQNGHGGNGSKRM
ncbi:MAG TPA: MarR family transcriptional regulator [Tepidisphaeraceae bacterium]|jgi:DNA-binding MarR family transcriptional regulator|nr:MarR family transcriptional regulator [Tepidisphaeraceae bacterium]